MYLAAGPVLSEPGFALVFPEATGRKTTTYGGRSRCRSQYGYQPYQLISSQCCEPSQFIFHYGVQEGIRIPDTRSHNPMLYLLSYSHHITGGLGQTRTADPFLTKEVLYLLSHETMAESSAVEAHGGGGTSPPAA